MKRNLILTDGGMGDLLCQLVAINYLHRQHPEIKFQIWLPDNILSFARHVLPSLKIMPFSQADKRFNNKLKGRTTQWFEHGHTPMRTHPVDYGFHMLADTHIYDRNQKNYLKIRPEKIDISDFKLPEKYVCIIVTATEPVKTMPIDTFNAIVDYVLTRGYTPVFLGREKALCGFKDKAVTAEVLNVDLSRGLNLVNQTDTLQATAVIAGAACVVGMDGGLIHAAGFTDTPIIAGYTLVDPQHVAPIRNGSQTYCFEAVEPDLQLQNRYFQTYNHFYEGDYRVFPGWEAIVASMTPEKFLKALKKII